MSHNSPSTLGLSKSFGFGDRLGLAGPGHIAAVEKSSFAPILAQQSIRELTRTARTPSEVMDAAKRAVVETGFDRPWGADADPMKNPDDARRMVQAGYTFFTIDPSEFVNNAADVAGEVQLRELVQAGREGLNVSAPGYEEYKGKEYFLGSKTYRFDEEKLLRSVVKYGRAIAHCEVMAKALADAANGRPFEIEVSIDETDSTTSPLDHLYCALELKRRGVKIVSLAPRFVGGFEKGVDYKGDVAAFEADLAQHVEIAKTFGPYKLSIHSGSDKFRIYPAIGRICGNLLHVKTAGTSYLEALRVVCRKDPSLFTEIVTYSCHRFSEDKASYHISATDEYVQNLRIESDRSWLERVFLDEDFGRQILHVTFGSVLTKGVAQSGRSFKEGILEVLHANPDLHKEVLVRHLGRHISELERG